MRRDFDSVSPLLETEDLDVSTKWFRDVLDFEIQWVRDLAACVAFEGQLVGLIEVEDPHPSRAIISRGGSRDVDRLYERYSVRNVMFLSPLGRQRAGMRGFTLSDPDGNLLTFTQPAATPLAVVKGSGDAAEPTVENN